jgi:hypothetical protein
MNRPDGRAARPDSGAHPDEMLAAAWLDGTLPPDRRDVMEAHLAGCAECRLSLTALAMESGAAAAPPAALLDRARDHTPAALRRAGLAAAAALLLILAGGWWLAQRPAGSPDPIYRGHADGLFKDLVPAPGATLAAAEARFGWSPVAGADRYTLVVTRPDTSVVLMLMVRPEGVPAAWPQGEPPLPGEYLWTVRALAVDREIAITRPIPFTLQ